MPQPQRSKVKLASAQDRERVKQAVLGEWAQWDWQEKLEQSCDYRLDGSSAEGWVRLKQYSNGTLYVEADDTSRMEALLTLIQNRSGQTALDVGKPSSGTKSSASAKDKLAAAKANAEANPIPYPYIGTDESGKGDYFGPLVVAGVLVTQQTAAELVALGVQDSKALNDQIMAAMVPEIMRIVGREAVAVVEMTPAKYNSLYNSFKVQGQNLNHMLAWAHATALENVLSQLPPSVDLSTVSAVADQFGNERYIKQKLKQKGQGITLHQMPRAEVHVGVAAASIVARQRFVSRLQRLSGQMGVQLPLGAGPRHAKVAIEVAKAHGKDALTQIAKLHFKTTETVMAQL